MSKHSGLLGEWIYGRRSAITVGAGALVVTMLCVGGASALMTGERSRYQVAAEGETATIPAIVTADTVAASGVVGSDDLTLDDVARLLGESRARSAETIEAGEAVYTAAADGRSADAVPGVLQRLRGALDEASETLAHEPPADASRAARERHIEELETACDSVLDAASVITQVRHVPAEQLPEGTTTITGPVLPVEEPASDPSGTPPLEPGGDPSGTPSGEPETSPSADPSGEPATDPSGSSPGPTPGETPVDPKGDVPAPGDPTGEPTGDPTGDPSPEPTDDGATTGLQGLFGGQTVPDDAETTPAG